MSLFRFSLLFCLLPVLPSALSAFNDPDDNGGGGYSDNGGLRRIAVTYSGSFSRVRIYIRARGEMRYRFYGEVRREHTRTIRLPAGRVYLVRLRHGSYRSVKRVYLPLSSDREVVFFSPNITGITVTLRGFRDWAYLSINGESRGRIRRGIPRQIELDPDRMYVIRAYRGGMERVRRIRLRHRGPGRHRRITLYLVRD